MDVQKMVRLLPEMPRQGMLDHFLSRRGEGGLGGEFLVFHRESITIAPALQAIMTADDWAVHSKKTKRRYGAVCHCTSCEETFLAGYVSDNCIRGIALGKGDDGQLYDGYPYVDDYPWDWVIQVYEGEHIQCPICDEYVQTVRKSKLQYGRTYQLAVASVENVEGYTALITWLIRRRIDEDGFWLEDVRPREALVIDEDRCLRRFTHTRGGGPLFGESDLSAWEYRREFRDGFQRKYYNYDSVNHMHVGGKCWNDIPNLAGTTGEKSGIKEYIEGGGDWPQMYLKAWRAHPNIENLVKAGWLGLIENEICRARERAFAYGAVKTTTDTFPFIDWEETRPHKMLGLSKEESKKLQIPLSDVDVFTEYRVWQAGNQKLSATAFLDLKKFFGGVEILAELRGLYNDFGVEWELQATLRYVRRHKEMRPSDVVQNLLDYRNMYRAEHPRRRKFTESELWPVALRREHDALAARKREKASREVRQKMQKGFIAVLEKYQALEWSDGELCIRLPRNNGELYVEGTVLRHCVKGYGEAHIAGRDTIFFVRKNRRPERSYYTLDINMTAKPREVQLHGYGNERHGKHLEHEHTIPPKVRDFVDRWKKEVLLPWYHQQQAEKAKKNKKAKENVA